MPPRSAHSRLCACVCGCLAIRIMILSVGDTFAVDGEARGGRRQGREGKGREEEQTKGRGKGESGGRQPILYISRTPSLVCYVRQLLSLVVSLLAFSYHGESGASEEGDEEEREKMTKEA